MNKKVISFQIPENILNQLDAHIVLQHKNRDNFIVSAIAHYMEYVKIEENGEETVRLVSEEDIKELSQLSKEIKAEIESLLENK